jgi:hypothetical protein
MKNGKTKKKSKTVSRKRVNKTKSKKANSGTKNNNRQTKSKGGNTTRVKSVRTNKSGFTKRTKKFSKEKKREREFYKLLEAIRLKDERVKPSVITKKRGDNLFVIKLPKRNDFDKKLTSLMKTSFVPIDKFLRKQPIEALYVFVTLKIKKPNEVGYYFNGEKSQASMVVNAENSKDFCIQLLEKYEEESKEIIQRYYDETQEVYNVVEMSLRFLFMKVTQGNSK